MTVQGDSGAQIDSSVKVRPARPVDREALALVWGETWHATYDPVLGPDGVRAMGYDKGGAIDIEAMWPRGNGCVLLATAGEEPAGTSVGALQQGTLFIWGMYVRPGFQRRGIGSRLIEALTRRFPQAQRAEVRVLQTSEHARAFYLRHGFAPAGEELRAFGVGPERRFWVMEKRLGRTAGIQVREATPDDLEAIVRLHEADAIGGHGDRWDEATRPAYEAAYRLIEASPANRLFVAVDGGVVVGTFQLTFIPGLTGGGALRAKLESVQVRHDMRSRGIGAALVAFAEAEARRGGAASLELTSNKRRGDAHRFYERLGFGRSHEGFKKAL